MPKKIILKKKENVEVNKPTSYTAKVTYGVPCLLDYCETMRPYRAMTVAKLRGRSFGSVGCMLLLFVCL